MVSVIDLKDVSDKQGRTGRHIDFLCLSCLHTWWKVLRTRVYNIPRQECPKCGSKEFAFADWDYKTLNLSKAALKNART